MRHVLQVKVGGYLAEQLEFDRALSDAEAKALDVHFGKWGVAFEKVWLSGAEADRVSVEPFAQWLRGEVISATPGDSSLP